MRTHLVVSILVLGACSSTPPPTPPVAADPVARYEQCWSHVAAGAWDSLRGCYSNDATSAQLGVGTATGPIAIVAAHRGWLDGFPDATFAPSVTIADGNDVVSIRWFSGTHTAALHDPLGEVPPSGKRIGLAMLHHVTLDEHGRVRAETTVFDLPTLMFQLGLSPGPARAASDVSGDPRVVIATHSASEQANAAAVRHAYTLWNARDPAFGAVLANEIVESNNSEPQDTVGKAALEQHNAALIGAFSNVRIDVERVLAAGHYTVSFAHMRGTHDGDLGPLKRTGKSIDVPLVEVIEWRDGKAIRSMPFLNGMQLATQLGMM